MKQQRIQPPCGAGNGLRRVAAALLLACLVPLAGGQGLPEELVVGGEMGYTPYETLDPSGRAAGFHPDLMRAASEVLGIPVRFVIQPWEAVRTGLQHGSIDVLGMFVSEERRQEYDFLQPHVFVYHRIYLPAGMRPIYSLREAEGRTVLVQRAGYAHEHLLALDLPNTTLVATADEREALRRLAEGGGDLAVLTEHRSRRILQEEGLTGPTVTGAPILPVAYAFAVRQGRSELVEALNEALDTLRQDGTFDRIYARWLGAAAEPAAAVDPPASDDAGVPPWLRWAAAAAVLLTVAVLLIARLRSDSETLAANRRIAWLRTHDPLTGAWNRAAWEGALRDRCERDQDRQRSGALLIVHVDRFRAVNRALGGRRADAALRRVAEVLQRLSGPNDVAARLGGDEFALLLDEADEAAALACGERLAEAVRALASDDPRSSVPLTASIGVRTFVSDGTAALTLLRDAEAACLRAKAVGGDRVQAWQEQDAAEADTLGDLRWMRELPRALAEDRMALYAQPIVPTDPASQAAPSLEVLVRMHERDGTVVPAGRFVAAAERYGLVDRIDRFVLATVLAWFDARPERLLQVARIHVNLSGRSLSDPRFRADLEALVRDAPGIASQLCFEVTETALIRHLSDAAAMMERLRSFGCRFALDDFGVGVTSVAYLRRLPVEILKIDGSFVRGMETDPEAERLVARIHDLATAVGMRTVAEQVEGAAVRKRLLAIGLHEVQGYHLGRPAPLADWTDPAATAAASSS